MKSRSAIFFFFTSLAADLNVLFGYYKVSRFYYGNWFDVSYIIIKILMPSLISYYNCRNLNRLEKTQDELFKKVDAIDMNVVCPAEQDKYELRHLIQSAKETKYLSGIAIKASFYQEYASMILTLSSFITALIVNH